MQGISLKQGLTSTGSAGSTGSSPLISTDRTILPNGNINYGVVNQVGTNLYSASFSNVTNSTMTPTFNSFVQLQTANNLVCYQLAYFQYLYGSNLGAVVDCQYTDQDTGANKTMLFLSNTTSVKGAPALVGQIGNIIPYAFKNRRSITYNVDYQYLLSFIPYDQYYSTSGTEPYIDLYLYN